MRLNVVQVGHWCGATLRIELESLRHVDAQRAILVCCQSKARALVVVCCFLAFESGEWPDEPGHCIGRRDIDVGGVKQERPSRVNILGWAHINA